MFDGLVEQQRAGNDPPLPEKLRQAIAAMDPEAPAAARLLGAASAWREQLNLPLLPSERAESGRWHAHVHARHPGDAFDRTLEPGRAFSRDDALQAALAVRQGS